MDGKAVSAGETRRLSRCRHIYPTGLLRKPSQRPTDMKGISGQKAAKKALLVRVWG